MEFYKYYNDILLSKSCFYELKILSSQIEKYNKENELDIISFIETNIPENKEEINSILASFENFVEILFYFEKQNKEDCHKFMHYNKNFLLNCTKLYFHLMKDKIEFNFQYVYKKDSNPYLCLSNSVVFLYKKLSDINLNHVYKLNDNHIQNCINVYDIRKMFDSIL